MGNLRMGVLLFMISSFLFSGGIQNTESVAAKEAEITIKMIVSKVKEAKEEIKKYKKILKLKEKMTKQRLRLARKVRVMSGVAYTADKKSFTLIKKSISIEELDGIIRKMRPR